MITVNRYPTPSQLRSFGALWLPLFGSASGVMLWWRGHPAAAVLVWAVVSLATVLALSSPSIAWWLFVGLSYVTYPIGLVVSLAGLAVLYFLIVTPIALALRLTGRDRLDLKGRTDGDSGWIPRRGRGTDAERAFRQF